MCLPSIYSHSPDTWLYKSFETKYFKLFSYVWSIHVVGRARHILIESRTDSTYLNSYLCGIVLYSELFVTNDEGASHLYVEQALSIIYWFV